MKKQPDRPRSSVLGKLAARLDSAPIAESSCGGLDSLMVPIGMAVQRDEQESYSFVYASSRYADEALGCHGAIDSGSDSASLSRFSSSESMASLAKAYGKESSISDYGYSASVGSLSSVDSQLSASLASLTSLGSSVSHAASSDKSVSPTQGYIDDQLPISRLSDATVDASNSPALSLTRSFLSTYTAHLSPTEQADFYDSVGKFIEKKLPQVALTTQQAIIDYFTDEGVLYPYVVEAYPACAWIVQSLLKEVISYPDQDSLLLNAFGKQWLKIQSEYGVSDQIALLKALRIKKLAHNLSLGAISAILGFVLAMGVPGYTIACSEESEALPRLKYMWLRQRILLWPHRFSFPYLCDSQRYSLCKALSNMDWGVTMFDSFIEAMQGQGSLEPIMEVLGTIQSYQVSDAVVHEALRATGPGKTSAKALAYRLRCHALLARIDRLSPDLAGSIKQPLANLLASSCSVQLLEKVITEHVDLITKHTPPFSEVLELLYDYQVTEDICALAFSLLPKVAGSDWVAKIDQAVSSALFEEAQEYPVDVLVKKIASSCSNFSTDRLREAYQAVIRLDCYSGFLASIDDPAINKLTYKLMHDWDQAALSLWAKQVKLSPSSIAQSELIAGVRHAVKLHYGFYPRPVQLLSLLTLLNPSVGKGRLAQINTGEGKSLIVAMLAAIHGLQGKKVDVVTTSTELSIPAVKEQSDFFKSLSLTVSENSHGESSAYSSDIVYGIAEDFQADILRTEFLGKATRGHRGFDVVIVDEVDSMLFDNRSHSVRLAGQTPGMTHLELPLGAIWEHLHRINSQMTTIDGQVFFIPEPFTRVGKTIVLGSGLPWSSCAERVTNKASFITDKVAAHLTKLLRELDDQEKKEYTAFKSLENEISTLAQSIAHTTDAKEKEANIASCKSLREKLNTLAWNQRYPVLTIPVHLRYLARSQIPYWIKSALDAAYGYKVDVHYTLQGNQIVPVNYNQTGVLQPNMVWSDGLTQFLQLKEGLPIDPEGISTNFLSNISFFKRYGSKLYGLTGTLGEASTKDFLDTMYDTDRVIIPPYQHRNILDNGASGYLCKGLCPIVLSDPKVWFQTIVDRAVSHASHQRGVLLICQHIREVKHLYDALCKKYQARKIFQYTGKEGPFEKSKIDAGEIIIATNIAGRGTDLCTTSSVESHGGLYVGVTFLPASYRVEMQNMGRTARAGKKGMGQLIIYDPVSADIADIKKKRYQEEVLATGKALEDAQKMLLQDRLFSDFCALERAYLPSVTQCALAKKWQDLATAYQAYQRQALTPAKIAQYVNKQVVNRQSNLMALSDEEASKITAADKKNYLDKVVHKAASERPYFEEQYKKAVLDAFCDAHSHLPAELLSCLESDRVCKPKVSDWASRYNWGLYDRKGLEEDWGIWLKSQHFEDKQLSIADALDRFDTGFAVPFRARAKADQLASSPYFYLLKGNEYLLRGDLQPAIAYYDRAIAMDPDFSLNALYNKAQALLSYENNKGEPQQLAYQTLQEAKKMIGTMARPALLTFSTFISQYGPKLLTSLHLQQQLDILSQQENYIDKACSVIQDAQSDKQGPKDVQLTTQGLWETFNRSDQDYSKAFREAAINGLTHLFTIEKVEPVPWHSIVGLALISLTQLTAGCLITACTAGALGTGLIVEGVSDMITTVKSAIQGSFDWAAWATQKAINLAVAIISSGIQGIKDGCKAIANTTKDLVGKTAVGATKDGVKLATRELGSALAKGAVKECLTAAAQWSTNKLFIEDLEKNIRTRVEAALTAAIQQNPLLLNALEVDLQNGNNAWQNCFIEEGLSLLKEQKEHVCLTMLREISLGVAKHKHSGVTPFLQIAGVATMLDELNHYTDAFIDKFNLKVQAHQPAITAALQEAASVRPSKPDCGVTTQETLSSEPPSIYLEEDDIIVDDPSKDATYTSKKELVSTGLQKFYSNQGPSTPQSLANAFKDQITYKLSRSVRSNLVNPAISYGVNGLTTALFRETDALTNQLREKVGTARELRDANNELALQEARKQQAAQKKKEKEEKRKREGKTITRKEENIPALNQNVQQGIERLTNDAPLDANELALLAASLGTPIYVYDANKKLIDVIGDKLPGKPIPLQHTKEEGMGHWGPLDQTIKVVPTGKHSCLIDAVFAQLPTEKKEAIKDVDTLRAKMIQTLHNNPEKANKAYKLRDKIASIAPDELRTGGGIPAQTIKKLMVVDAYIDASPKL